MKEYILWHDKETKQLIENFEVNWKMDARLNYAYVKRCCADKSVEIEMNKVFRTIFGYFSKD